MSNIRDELVGVERELHDLKTKRNLLVGRIHDELRKQIENQGNPGKLYLASGLRLDEVSGWGSELKVKLECLVYDMKDIELLHRCLQYVSLSLGIKVIFIVPFVIE